MLPLTGFRITILSCSTRYVPLPEPASLPRRTRSSAGGARGVFPSRSHLASRVPLRRQVSGQARVFPPKGFGCEHVTFLFRESKL